MQGEKTLCCTLHQTYIKKENKKVQFVASLKKMQKKIKMLKFDIFILLLVFYTIVGQLSLINPTTNKLNVLQDRLCKTTTNTLFFSSSPSLYLSIFQHLVNLSQLTSHIWTADTLLSWLTHFVERHHTSPQ